MRSPFRKSVKRLERIRKHTFQLFHHIHLVKILMYEGAQENSTTVYQQYLVGHKSQFALLTFAVPSNEIFWL